MTTTRKPVSDIELDEELRSFGIDPAELNKNALAKFTEKAAEYTARGEAVPERLAEAIRQFSEPQRGSCKACDGRGTEADYVGLEMRCVEVECSTCGGSGIK